MIAKFSLRVAVLTAALVGAASTAQAQWFYDGSYAWTYQPTDPDRYGTWYQPVPAPAPVRQVIEVEFLNDSGEPVKLYCDRKVVTEVPTGGRKKFRAYAGDIQLHAFKQDSQTWSALPAREYTDFTWRLKGSGQTKPLPTKPDYEGPARTDRPTDKAEWVEIPKKDAQVKPAGTAPRLSPSNPGNFRPESEPKRIQPQKQYDDSLPPLR